jgi:biotin carboxyl carrier protein
MGTSNWRQQPRALQLKKVALIIASLGCSQGVMAFDIPTGESDLKVRWDNTVKYSVAYRLSNPDEKVAAGDAMVPGFLAPGRQLDDGDRNFKRGLVSNRVDLFSELDVTYKNIGARVSGAAWYDDVYNRGNDNSSDSVNSTSVGAGQFNNGTRDMMGRKAEVLDAFLFLRSDQSSETPYTVRLGKHTVLYGESLFFGANGIANAQAPMDLIKLLSVPGSQFKEIIRPVGQVSTQVQVSSNVSVGAYYQYQWEKNRLPPSGSYLSDVDFVGAGKRKELEHAIGRHPSDSDLASYLMYPKVFRDYAEHRREFGDVSLLPTSPFFYGLQDREEIAIDIDKGKTLVVRQTGRAEAPDEEGKVKVFFELNGQPRTARVPKAGLEGASKARAKADVGNASHVGAPMPGMVVTVAVKPGQKVSKGAPLLSIEAMKMETMLSAERDVVIKAIHIKPGDVIAAKDLLIEID